MTIDNDLYDFLKLEGKQTRTELVSQTGNARSTLYDALGRLEIKGKVKRNPDRRGNRGRPRVYFEAIN